MSSLKYWVNQTVLMQSALGAAQAIDAISKASPGVITKNAGAALPSNGDFVLLEVVGMRQVHHRVFKVAGASGSTFNIGVDTSGFTDFVSGSYKVITWAHEFDSIRDLASSGGEGIFEDTTSVHDASDTEDLVSTSPEKFSGTHNWDPAFAPLIAANTAYLLRSPRAFRVEDSDGTGYAFYATVGAPLNPAVSGRKKVTPINLSLKAPGVAYA